MTMDTGGNLYGTAEGGGPSQLGTVFEPAPGSGAITTLARFNGSDGTASNGAPVMDGGGNPCGTTDVYGGGVARSGTAFELPKGSGTIILTGEARLVWQRLRWRKEWPMPPADRGQCPAFPGTRVLPKDPRYRALCRGFNQRFQGEPGYVEVCGSPEQVRHAVQLAVEHALRITARCGGHCYEGFVTDNDGGVILDLSPLRCVSKGPDGLYGVEGGCTLWDVYVQLYRKYGVTLPDGTCYSGGSAATCQAAAMGRSLASTV
jgi:uncharacterized repeat protein (TIGR03803 family)